MILLSDIIPDNVTRCCYAPLPWPNASDFNKDDLDVLHPGFCCLFYSIIHER